MKCGKRSFAVVSPLFAALLSLSIGRHCASFPATPNLGCDRSKADITGAALLPLPATAHHARIRAADQHLTANS
jgi:hypothetical protein